MSSPPQELPGGAVQRLLLFSVVFVALPHALHLHFSIFLLFALLAAWRWAADRHPPLRPGRVALLLLTLGGAGLVYVQYHRFYGRDGGAALFLVGLGLKLMEMRTRRELYLVVYLAFFVALTQYLFSQTLPMAGYTLVAVGLVVAVLIGANGGARLPVLDWFRHAALLLGQAIPVMAVLFLFFPRLAGPLWKLPDDEPSASTGLSEVIEPGSFSRLGKSSEPAFRVEFEGPPPPSALRYWRGPVFWDTDGRRWTLGPETPLPSAPKVEVSGPAYRYVITLEPHRRRWVFALDLATEFPAQLAMSPDLLLLSKEKLTERQRFALVSRPHFRTGPLDGAERQRGLRLPEPPPPRILALVDSWRPAAPDPGAMVERALRYFREEPFVYTLAPPLLEERPVERFLFETRQGFCEHFATAFVYLMRVAGIPARVVTGYQGGQWNPVGQFLEVRQADAHAWAEVWLPGRGWTRVDPTAAVAPERIQQGIDPGQATAGAVQFNPAGDAMGQGRGFPAWLRQTRLFWASLDHAWNRWVLSYDPARQRRFFETLGMVDWRGLALWSAGFLALSGIAVALLLRRPWRRDRPDPALALYGLFLNKLARRGIVKGIGEGPVAFSQRAARELPRAALDIARITADYVAIRYGRGADPARCQRLRRRVRAFRP